MPGVCGHRHHPCASRWASERVATTHRGRAERLGSRRRNRGCDARGGSPTGQFPSLTEPASLPDSGHQNRRRLAGSHQNAVNVRVGMVTRRRSIGCRSDLRRSVTRSSLPAPALARSHEVLARGLVRGVVSLGSGEIESWKTEVEFALHLNAQAVTVQHESGNA
jgi:hypothetical protein